MRKTIHRIVFLLGGPSEERRLKEPTYRRACGTRQAGSASTFRGGNSGAGDGRWTLWLGMLEFGDWNRTQANARSGIRRVPGFNFRMILTKVLFTEFAHAR